MPIKIKIVKIEKIHLKSKTKFEKSRKYSKKIEKN